MDEQRVEFSWAGETARQVGILVHEVIQRIGGEGLERWREERIETMLPAWHERLEHVGVAPGDLDEATRRTADSIRNLLEDERATWFLDTGHAQAGSELELSVLDGQRVRRMRIDRTFVDEHGVRWIVDYKTSAHEGSAPDAFLDEEMRRYQRQMESYAGAFRKMESNEIRLGLYFPLLKGWREWQYSG
jgi:ATP-dependent exoDNAse (exonuclease V) beta subunit